MDCGDFIRFEWQKWTTNKAKCSHSSKLNAINKITENQAQFKIVALFDFHRSVRFYWSSCIDLSHSADTTPFRQQMIRLQSTILLFAQLNQANIFSYDSFDCYLFCLLHSRISLIFIVWLASLQLAVQS